MTYMAYGTKEGWFRFTESGTPQEAAGKFNSMLTARRLLIHPFSEVEVREVPICVWCRAECGHFKWCQVSTFGRKQ